MTEETPFRPIRKLLIANRGEIASRIQRTCREMGIATVAVFSDADAGAPFVRTADEAFRLGPPEARKSYLHIDRILEAARVTGADAVHPGFGFLAENADFAAAVEAAGFAFVGPSPETIRVMGSKAEAKRIAREAEVPVIPGTDGAEQDPAKLADAAREMGLPVLVKASAGGGGKGMRIVREATELADAIEGARREAESAFGDGTLLIEKYIERPRHVEIQILGDAHGNLVHLHERECSIQRRHQKIIEESPSPALDEALREEMGAAALRLAEAIGYRSAGTVEMILAPDGAFYFLEVNTRLQVEHPVTEAISDLDLVELQLRVARLEPLPIDQEMVDTLISGHAIECRLYAEDPAQGFLPQTGRIIDWELPTQDWLRVDTGVEKGSEVGIHYDPMLAKVITWGPGRIDAVTRMRDALRRLAVQGVRTNRDFLLAILDHPAFVRGELSTHFIDEHFGAEGLATPAPDTAWRDAALAATFSAWQARRDAREILPTMRTGYRNAFYAPQRVSYFRVDGARELALSYVDRGEGLFDVAFDDEAAARARLVGVAGPVVTFEDASGHRRRVRIVRAGEAVHAFVGEHGLVLHEVPRFPDRDALAAADGCVAPMPGKVVDVRVEEGARVEAGQVLVVMEAMKMEHSIRAPHDGVVTALDVAVGDQVEERARLALVEADES